MASTFVLNHEEKRHIEIICVASEGKLMTDCASRLYMTERMGAGVSVSLNPRAALSVPVWTGHLASQSLSVLICKMGAMMEPAI